jgi:hypothetical protein
MINYGSGWNAAGEHAQEAEDVDSGSIIISGGGLRGLIRSPLWWRLSVNEEYK